MDTSPNRRIEVLPQALADKIAAGEVVEHPASVLKELVENALDAGARKITAEVEDAGFAQVRVADDGAGMSADDVASSVIRHATSKIHSLGDLESISTMGFRGEALASIAAVSRTDIVSSSDTSGLGYRLVVEGSRVAESAPAARPRGTTITVRDLFYNTPARKKFMKSRRAERFSIVRLFEQLVTPFPDVHFVLTIDGRTVIEAPPVSEPRERICQYAGADFAAALLEIRGDVGSADVQILMSPPEMASPRPRFQELFVNLRRVDNDSLAFSLRNACAPFYPNNVRPAYFAFVDMPPSEMDVNIHPTKQRVKFGDERRLAGGVHHLVERKLRESFSVSLTPSEQPEGSSFPSAVPNASETAQSPEDYRPVGFGTGTASPLAEAGGESAGQTVLPFPTVGGSPQETAGATAAPEPGTHESWELITCYQIHGMFILAPIKNGIMLVDQHAAHERILFEQALDDLEHGSAASQQLLFPIVMELSPAEKPLLTGSEAYLRSLGYEISDFGGSTISISAIPAFMRDSQAEEAVREMAAFLLDDTSVRHFSQPTKRYAAAFACGSAIKAGQELSREEMSALLNSLFATRNPYTCPHGRPTVTRLSLAELRRRFLR